MMLKAESAIKVAASGCEGVGFTISKEMAEDLIEQMGLVMADGPGCMSGETMCPFAYNDVTLRLVRDWMGRYKLYKGLWKRDPHWTGD